MVKKIVLFLLTVAMMSAMLVSCDLSSLDLGIDIPELDDVELETDALNDDAVLEMLNGNTPFQVYAQFEEQLEAASSNCTVKTTSTMNTVMNILGQNIVATTDVEMVVMSNGDNCYSKSTTKTNASGIVAETAIETWYVDGILYTESNGQKIKMAITKEQALELVYGEKSEGEGSIANIPESWFEGVSFEKKADGYVMKIDMSGDRMEEAVERLGIAPEAGLEFSDVKYQYTVDKNGNILSSEADFTMTMEDSSSNSYSASADGKIVAEYLNFGTTEEIAAPDDADAYIEVTYDQIFGK